MKHRALDSASRYLVASAFALLVLMAALAWSYMSGALAWTFTLALLLSGALVAVVLRRAAAANDAMRRDVEHHANRLRQVAAGQSRFIDSLAHEIKTPLSIVLNHAELLVRCSDDAATARGHAKSLADYTLHFSELLEGFLRLGDPASKPDTRHHLPVHVHDLVVEAVRRSQSGARGRGVNVALTIGENSSDHAALEVFGNEALLEAMIESIVRHAVRASWRGARVELQVRARNESILVHVRHHGMTLAPSELDSLFEWFSQSAGPGEQSTSNGAGLAISMRIAQHHGGTIEVQNHAAGGCEFVITLPRYRGGEEAPAAPVTEHAATRPAVAQPSNPAE